MKGREVSGRGGAPLPFLIASYGAVGASVPSDLRLYLPK